MVEHDAGAYTMQRIKENDPFSNKERVERNIGEEQVRRSMRKLERGTERERESEISRSEREMRRERKKGKQLL